MQDLENTGIDDEGHITEDTAASDTLKPNGTPGDSKPVMLATFMQLLAQLGKEDLSSVFNQVQSQFGPNGPLNGVDTSAANKATIVPKGSVKEDVTEIFGSEELSEEFRERTEVIFEAALASRLTIETARLEEAFAAKETELTEALEVQLEERATEIFTELSEKLDQYLDHTVAEWISENQVAIDNGLRADIAENFIGGLHSLFKEHYIKVPEESFDIVADLKASVNSLEAKLNETVDRNIELESLVTEAEKAKIVGELSEGLTLSQSEKLRTLAEGVEFNDLDTFRKKAGIIKENYFNKKTVTTGLIVEAIDGEVEQLDEQTTGVTDPTVNKYVQAISKTSRK